MLDIDDLRKAATERTGLTDFGSSEFEEPLVVLVQSYNNDADLSEFGHMAIREDLIGDLSGRLRVVEGLKARPEALDATIERPVFIVGFPRTGTTTLHNMMQANPDCQVLENWIALNPKPRPPKADWETDPDYSRVVEMLRQQYEANPELRAQHDISAGSADECRFLFKQAFMDDGYGYLCNLPGYWEWFEKSSMEPAYRWHQQVLKLIQHPADAGRRWVLKYPSHMAWIKNLLAIYPDACIIQTHRDPAATIPSFASLICNAAQMFSDGRSATQMGPFLARQWRARVDRFMKDRDELDRESQFFDLQFGDILNDPVDGVAKAFTHFGLDLSDEAKTAMSGWVASHPRGRHGGHSYTAEEFGLDLDDLSSSFAPYRERFGVPTEKR